MDAEAVRTQPGGAPPASPPHRVRVPVNVHDWVNLTFLHWPVEPSSLAGLVPGELALLTYEDAAWVGVTPFFIRVRPPGLPTVPRLSAFPETNVRTYVAGPDGREGLWFLRMEVTRAWFVAALRAIGLPYVRQRMTVEQRADRVTYRSWSARGVSHHVVARRGDPIAAPGGVERDRFLTARWGAYHRRGGLWYTPADHPPWPLHTAVVETCEVAPLLSRAGLPPPVGRPLAHFSPGVTTRIGRPQRVAR